MEKGSDLSGIMQAWVAANTSLNSNFADMSLRNGAIQTDKIMSLANYMGKENPDKFKNHSEELKDDNKLMRTYVVPIMLPNGQKLDLVVNAKGQDLAQIYIDEEGKDRFHLDDSVKSKIILMAGKEITKDRLYEKEFLPKNLEDLAEKIEDNELIPKTEENVKERKKEVDDNRSVLDEEKPEEEKTPEEVAAEIGIELSALEKYCEDNEISIKNIKGAQKVENSEKLEESLDSRMPVGHGDNVVVLRISGVDGKTNDSFGLMKEDGTSIDYKGGKDEMLNELVPENSNGNEVADDDEIKFKQFLELEHEDGSTHTHEAEIQHQGDMDYFKEMYDKITKETEEYINEVDADGSIGDVQKARMKADFLANKYGSLCKLERETNVTIPSLHDEELGKAQDAENEASKKEGINTLTLGAYEEMTTRDKGTDERETDHSMEKTFGPKHNL